MRTRHLVASALVVLGLASVAAAQSARAVGVVKDISGKPIKGATVRAVNPDASPSEFTSATDDKGRWAMIGLRSGTWKFIAEAPGHLTVQADAPVRVASAPPITFTLIRDIGPVPDALGRNVQQELLDAESLRDSGRLDQALSAYQDIRARNPKLTTINLVIADLYRKKAAQAPDATARQALLKQALDAYDLMLKGDATNARALAERAAVRAANTTSVE